MTVGGKLSRVLELRHFVCYPTKIRRVMHTVGMSMRQLGKSPSTQMRATGRAQQDKRLTGSWMRKWWLGRDERKLPRGKMALKLTENAPQRFMSLSFSKISRAGLDPASVATSIGFTAAKLGTKFGVCSLTNPSRFMAYGALCSSLQHEASPRQLLGSPAVLDYGLFGGRASAGPVLSNAVVSTLSIIEQITLAPILISESLTSTSFIAGIGSLDLISAIIPGGGKKRHFPWAVLSSSSVGKHFLPEKRYIFGDRGRKSRCRPQGLTREWQEKRRSPYLRKIYLQKPSPSEMNPLRSPPAEPQPFA